MVYAGFQCRNLKFPQVSAVRKPRLSPFPGGLRNGNSTEMWSFLLVSAMRKLYVIIKFHGFLLRKHTVNFSFQVDFLGKNLIENSWILWNHFQFHSSSIHTTYFISRYKLSIIWFLPDFLSCISYVIQIYFAIKKARWTVLHFLFSIWMLFRLQNYIKYLYKWIQFMPKLNKNVSTYITSI